MPNEILEVTKRFMREPIRILVKKEELTLEGIKQFYVNVEKEDWKVNIVFNITDFWIDELFFLNDTELLRLPHYQIRQAIAQSKRLDEYTSGKPKKKSQKKFPPTQFLKNLKIDHFG